MDEEMEFMEDFFVDEPSSFFSDDDFIDPDYEFDASHFYDFSRYETESEAEEAENWFRYAHEYPPSPFIVKLKLMKAAKLNHSKAHKTSSKKIEASRNTSTTSSISDGDIDHGSPSRDGKIKGMKHQSLIRQDSVKAKPKSTVSLSKPSGSSFMKPTASHLAKQNKESDIQPGNYGRLQKPLITAVEKLQSPIRCQNQATKRQKLEIGYLRKLLQYVFSSRKFDHYQLVQDPNVLHLVAQMEINSNSKSKTSIPRKPALVTEERAQSRRSQNKSEAVQQAKANTPGSKARPLNRKIIDAPKRPQPKKSMTHLTEFQALYKSNSAPPVSEDIVMKRQSSLRKDTCRSPNNLKARTPEKVHQMKDGGFVLNSKRNSQLPIELFKKLSLKSESETKNISSLKPRRLSKASKENAPRPFLQQEFRRYGGRPNQCGSDRRIIEVKPQPNRSVDIR
ncbi:hypothetical protein OSB04_025557 [Centaurea solstitialis]|uniref:TPX2 central domain-containing protein n=1 Tax=Centaurea solstitialis TaxID=347529 RepID=A0AA38SNA6_9ASTR|nr:hypothetical protein OSB04_025557 [Centaurea solstitialis]